jgi:hypothetical protein
MPTQVNQYQAALAAKKKRDAKTNKFADAEADRIAAALKQRKVDKGFGDMRPPSPPKTVEERSERLIAAGISTLSLREDYLQEQKKIEIAVKEKLRRKRIGIDKH